MREHGSGRQREDVVSYVCRHSMIMGRCPSCVDEYPQMIVLPPNTTFANVEAWREAWTHNRGQLTLGAGSDLTITGPRESYDRYRRALYGPRPTDWMPFFQAGLVGSVGSLVAAIVWALS